MDPVLAAVIGLAGALAGVLGTAVRGLIQQRMTPRENPTLAHEVGEMAHQVGEMAQATGKMAEAVTTLAAKMDRQSDSVHILSTSIAVQNERLSVLLSRSLDK